MPKDIKFNIDIVYVLHHVNERNDAKTIGFYTSRPDAEKAIARLKHLPGFRDYIDYFRIDEFEINKDYWPEGYVTLYSL